MKDLSNDSVGEFSMSETVALIEPDILYTEILSGKSPQMIDVRDPSEFKHEHIIGSVSIPLSQLVLRKNELAQDQPVILICLSSARAKRGYLSLTAAGVSNCQVLEGGLHGWTSRAYPTESLRMGVWSMERQVRFAAGFLILIGILLTASVNPNWICFSGFVAVGMMFSAITNSCGMATILGIFPWNRISKS